MPHGPRLAHPLALYTKPLQTPGTLPAIQTVPKLAQHKAKMFNGTFWALVSKVVPSAVRQRARQRSEQSYWLGLCTSIPALAGSAPTCRDDHQHHKVVCPHDER